MSTREDDIFGMIDDYVHDLLSPEERELVRRRITESKVWAAAHAEAIRRRDLLSGLPASETSDRLVEATLRHVTTEGPRRQRRNRLWITGGVGLLAAAVALFIGLGIYFQNLAPSPYDLSIMGQRTLTAGSNASLRIRLSDPGHLNGIAGSTVSVSLRDPRSGETLRLAEFQTDDTGSGSPRLALPDWADGEYELRVSATTPSGLETITRSVELRRDWRVVLGTDKPVYQPGQTIRMRTYALRTASGQPVGGEGVTFEVADAKGNLIFRERTITSEFGIASADCPLADLLVEGQYTVRARVGKTESAQAVEVRRYTLPKFRLDAKLDRSFYAPGDVIRGTVDGVYFFGAPVASGMAEVRATLLGQAGVPQVMVQTVQLDDAGHGTFTVRVPDALVGGTVNESEGTMEIGLVATDSAGQRVERTVHAVISATPMRITLVPESGRLVAGLDNEVFVFVTAPDGQPVDARVSVEGVPQDLRTGELGVASFTLSADALQRRREHRPEGKDELLLAVRAVDDQGGSVNQEVALSRDRASDSFILRTDAAAYDAGSNAHITVFGGGRDPVFVDLLRNEQTILTDSIAMNGTGTLSLDLPVDLSGVCRLVAYRFVQDGRVVRQERTILVRPAPGLRVAVETGAQTHRPGEHATLTLAVSGRDGQPAPGAVSLAIVDEAVMNVRGGGGLDSTFADLHDELLKPVYAVYPWDPFDPRTREGVAARGIAALAGSPVPTERDRVLATLVEQGFIDEGFVEDMESNLGGPPRTEWLERMFEPETVALLQDTGGSYSLRDATLARKAERVQAQKRAWAQTVKSVTVGGITIVVSGIFVAVMVAGVRSRGAGCLVEALVLVCVLVLLIGILLPSLGKARRAARNSIAMSDARQLGFAIEMAREEGLLDPSAPGPATSPARVREWFPETLLWKPQIVTDDQGRAVISVPLADSITNWKITGGAIATDGRLGTIAADLVVFQPFFVDIDAPVALTRGDVYDLPLVVYSFLDAPQTVTLAASPTEGVEYLSGAEQTVPIEPGEVRAVTLRIRASGVGETRIEVHARGIDLDGREVADAIRRTIRIVPEGETVERIASGVLRAPASHPIDFPAAAVPDSAQVILKLYPTPLAQFLEGLEGIFQRPYGCFEQTSSTTYPNLLALDYLRRAGMDAPEVEAAALQYIHLGYQRLLSFEVAGGGFDWFGRAPANRTLTAYGLMEFEDMARVRDVDPALIERTRQWLLSQQNSDGSWTPESHAMHEDPTGRGGAARVTTTAYIAWAAFRGGPGTSDAASRAARFLGGFPAESMDDPYTVALVALALHEAAGKAAALPYLTRLAALARRDGDHTWWGRSSDARTVFYGAGAAGDVEATALAAIAMLEAGEEPGATSGALAWLAARRDAHGAWNTTQATVLALQAMVLAAERPGPARRREVEITIDGTATQRVVIEADQADVVRMLDLTEQARNRRRIEVADTTGTATAYQLVLRHNENPGVESTNPGPLAIRVAYGSSSTRVGEWMDVTATVHNLSAASLPMVVLDLPIPPGFEVETAAFEAMRTMGSIEKFELTPRSVIVYLREVRPSQQALPYRIRATTPVEVTVPGATAAEYYTPEVRSVSPEVRLEAVM